MFPTGGPDSAIGGSRPLQPGDEVTRGVPAAASVSSAPPGPERPLSGHAPGCGALTPHTHGHADAE